LCNLSALVARSTPIYSLFPYTTLFRSSEVRKVYCDGDTVIVELTNRGKVSNGKNYENEYCFVFELENDKIRRIREYVDTQKAKRSEERRVGKECRSGWWP